MLENGLTQFPAWQVFTLLGLLLVIGEVFLSGFFLLPIGLGFVMTALLALFVKSWPILLISLAVSQVGLFAIFQKAFRRYLGQTKAYTNIEGMIGAECEVTEEIPVGRMGYVKLYGDRWQARSFSEKPILKGQRVVITKLDGNKVLVEPIY